MPLVSILVTVYNRERFLQSALESVLTQTFPNFEVIVVDDCSRDQSVSVARQFEHDPRVRVVVNERNLGDYGNRCRAASLAQGRYLKYVDSDDLIYPHSLAIMVAAMEAHPTAALALSHSAPEADEPYPWCLSPEEAWRKQFLGPGCLSCGPSGAIIKRQAFEQIGGFRNWGVLNDLDLWFLLSARWPVVLLPPGLIWWRRHTGQEFTKDGAHITYLERGYALVTEHLSSPECPLSTPDREAALRRARQHHARRILSLAAKTRNFRAGLALFRKSGLSTLELMGGLKHYS